MTVRSRSAEDLLLRSSAAVLADGRGALLGSVSEREFQRWVIALAQRSGFLVHHEFDSRRGTAGFPDLWLARAGSPLLAVELKTERGSLRPAQREWIDTLDQATGVRALVWRPSMEDGIREELGR